MINSPSGITTPYDMMNCIEWNNGGIPLEARALKLFPVDSVEEETFGRL